MRWLRRLPVVHALALERFRVEACGVAITCHQREPVRAQAVGDLSDHGLRRERRGPRPHHIHNPPVLISMSDGQREGIATPS